MLNTVISTPVSLTGLLLVLVAALVLGLLTSLVFSYKSSMSASMALTLVILPVAMSLVVLLINGNLGIAVAVAGSFALIRFRSIAGTGRDICAVFCAMTLGVVCGMGYLGVAALFYAIILIVVPLLTALRFGERRNEKLIRITIPEEYDYAGLFDDVFEKFGAEASIEKIKTTNLGSLIDVTYKVTLRENTVPKAMLDALRMKNGNLSIMIMNCAENRDVL